MEVRVRDLDIGDLLGLLESPQEEVAREVRILLKDTFSNVKESWLITGLLEYFYISNSGRLLDILLGVNEPHDRHLLDKLMEGLKGPDRFRHTCILLYAVRRQPPPTWLHKFLSHGAMKELLRVLGAEENVPVLVGAVMVIVILMPLLPHEMGRVHLNTIMDVFCRLVRLTPKSDIDKEFQPFLQVAVYSLFHRLYAMYPCHFLTCLRNSFTKPNSSACFFTTLKPMMEKVRLHPLLITETKDSELNRTRWKGLESHQLILECARLCLDPIEATCEDTCGSFFVLSMNSESTFEAVPIPANWLIHAAENNFWSPTLALPAPPTIISTPHTSSVPHTPVYPISASSLKQMGRAAESPPEAAIEATPETTPFTSPLKMDASNIVRRRPNTAVCHLSLNTGKDSSNQNQEDACSSPLSPKKKDQSPFKFPDDHTQNIFSRAERSTLINSKLQEILKERKQIQKDGAQATESKGEALDIREGAGKDVKDSAARLKEKDSSKKVMVEKQNLNVVENEVSVRMTNDITIMHPPDQSYRRRKMSMYDDSKIDFGQLGIPGTDRISNGNEYDWNHDKEQDNDMESNDRRPFSMLDTRISEEKESTGSESRRASDENQDEQYNPDCDENVGLGVPSQRSMTDLVKNMKTMRLRFLSQCGPPPDLSQFNTMGTVRPALSPTKPGSLSVKSLYSSSSCPDLTVDGNSLASSIGEGRIRKESALSSLTLSPIRQAVVTTEATTQTEEITVVNPYEQLLEALLSGSNSSNNPKGSDTSSSNEEIEVSKKSPHELLDKYLELSTSLGSGSRNVLWQQTTSQSGVPVEVLRDQIRVLQVLLLLERYKRQVHAERNRRLLGRVKKVYALEEEYQGLQAKASHVEDECAHLKRELANLQISSATKEQQLHSTLSQQETKINKILLECNNSQEDREVLKEQCAALSRENSELNSQIQSIQAALFDKDRQLTVQEQMAKENDILREQVKELHKQVCLMGEVQDQYKQEIKKLKETGSPSMKIGLELERKSALKQIENFEKDCSIKSAALDAALHRVSELEDCFEEKCKELDHARTAIKAAREAGAEQCRAVEARCQALSSANQILETAILEQHDKNDRLIRQVRRSQRGKSICSDGIDIDYELSVSPGTGIEGSGAESSSQTLGKLYTSQSGQLQMLNLSGEPVTEFEGRKKT